MAYRLHFVTQTLTHLRGRPLEGLIERIEMFTLVLARLMSMLTLMPVFKDRALPVTARLAFAFVLSLSITPRLSAVEIDLLDTAGFTLLMGREIALGIVFGFASEMIFQGVRFAGQIISFQMGFAIVTAFDPQFSDQISIMAQFKSILATFIFIVIDGHFMLLETMVRSFDYIPLLQAEYPGSLMQYLIELTGSIFVIGIQVSAPIMVTLLMTNVAMAIMARTVPQMNVFIVGFPLTIGIGMMSLSFTLPLFKDYFAGLMTTLRDIIAMLLRLLGPA